MEQWSTENFKDQKQQNKYKKSSAHVTKGYIEANITLLIAVIDYSHA